ncbi:hypothetical protein Q4Q34_09355 [Flavivirga abyssicola]|uniref:hypothetical protein n=1 Tax=Flavivirga abyssicola TaxID=3063533 RepID=UPI0026DEB97D|nr:hypothetical protein [Flavivirga sp. MEBiC07777]WVK15234.1 hypothetical protein Q4Q34_09355 [Flavivirga sp. MEBiC07777]
MKITKKFHEHLKNINDVSKKSFLIIGTVVLSILSSHATTLTSNLNTTTVSVDITNENLVKVYDWKVETNKSIYSGTSLSVEDAKRMIALTSSGEIVRASKIESYFVLKTEAKNNSKRNYFWEVETATGRAKGYSSTEAYAYRMIQLVASGDAIVSKKIISQPQQ